MTMGMKNGIKSRRQGVLLAVLAALVLLSCLVVAPGAAFADEAAMSTHTTFFDKQALVHQPETEVPTEANSSEEEGYSTDDIIDAQTNHSGAHIPDTEVPLTGTITSTQANATQGSILNTLLVAVCAVSMLAMLIALSVRKTKDYRIIAVRTVAAAVGLVMIASWSLMDKLQTPAEMINESTVFIAALFSIYTVILVYSYIYEARLKKASSQEEK